MANKITNTPIAVDWYASLTLRQQRTQSHGNCVVQPDGTLWVAVLDPADKAHIFRSTDNGFSWSDVIQPTGVPGRWASIGTAKGTCMFITIDEQERNFDLIGVEWEFLGSTYDVNRSRYDLDSLTDAPTNTLLTSNPQASGGFIDLGHSHRNSILVFTDGTNIGAKLLSPRSTSVSSEVDDADNVHQGIGPATIIDEDGLAYCIYTSEPGGANLLRFNIFTSNSSNGTWGTPATIETFGGTSVYGDDPVICRDGYGTLMAAWVRRTGAQVLTIQYSISTDSGGTWGTTQNVTLPSGYETYTEPVASVNNAYLDAIAGRDGGFLITFCAKQTSDGFGHTFVQQISTTDGTTYTLGTAKEIGTRYSGQDVVGGHFFRPTTVKLLDLSDPGLVRIAYTVGEGDDADGDDDMSPVTFAQELLSEVAFPSQLTSDTGSYTQDTAGTGELLVSFNIVGSPQDNVDFHALGMTGSYTTKYTQAFNKLGTSARLLRYEPTAANLMNDRSAYGSPTETSALVLFDPVSYAFPTPSVDETGLDAWIERDVRKIYLPPNTHLARTFTVNAGGYLKRTVWLTEFDGNEYELSQVVPRFISNQICYYEANAYVVGPSRDPFSRTVLPSET